MVAEIVVEGEPAIYLEGISTIIYMRSLRPLGLLDDIESCHSQLGFMAFNAILSTHILDSTDRYLIDPNTYLALNNESILNSVDISISSVNGS